MDRKSNSPANQACATQCNQRFIECVDAMQPACLDDLKECSTSCTAAIDALPSKEKSRPETEATQQIEPLSI